MDLLKTFVFYEPSIVMPAHMIETSIQSCDAFLRIGREQASAGIENAGPIVDEFKAGEISACCQIKSPPLLKLRRAMSGRLDSNQRPLAPHANALPGCATSRITPSGAANL